MNLTVSQSKTLDLTRTSLRVVLRNLGLERPAPVYCARIPAPISTIPSQFYCQVNDSHDNLHQAHMTKHEKWDILKNATNTLQNNFYRHENKVVDSMWLFWDPQDSSNNIQLNTTGNETILETLSKQKGWIRIVKNDKNTSRHIFIKVLYRERG